jgi:radical SAM protein with 4Fe4S-binding SPASM domain
MSPLPTDYNELVHELLDRAVASRQPASGTFELTHRCNLACRMCFVRQAAGDCSARDEELPASAWLGLAREAVDHGMVLLLLTGGEIFLRPDFFEIYEPLTRMGLILTLFTNGTLITAAVARRLAQLPPSRIHVTLYGATAATYEAVTGIPGSYDRCRAGIEALLDHRLPLALKGTILRQNVHELEAMRQMAQDWDIAFNPGWLLSRRRDGGPSDVERCRLSGAACAELDSADSFTGAPLDNFHCRAGKASFVVTPRGEMITCLSLPFPAVQPARIGFPAAWNQVQQYVDSAPPLAAVCRTCEARDYCPRCPAVSYLETGTLTEPVPHNCEIARARQARFGQRA